jgi:hypothetical protein
MAISKKYKTFTAALEKVLKVSPAELKARLAAEKSKKVKREKNDK